MAVKLYGYELKSFPTLATAPDSFSNRSHGKALLKISSESHRIWLTDADFVVHEVRMGEHWKVLSRYPCDLIRSIEQDYFRLFGVPKEEDLLVSSLPSAESQRLALDQRTQSQSSSPNPDPIQKSTREPQA